MALHDGGRCRRAVPLARHAVGTERFPNKHCAECAVEAMSDFFHGRVDLQLLRPCVRQRATMRVNKRFCVWCGNQCAPAGLPSCRPLALCCSAAYCSAPEQCLTCRTNTREAALIKSWAVRLPHNSKQAGLVNFSNRRLRHGTQQQGARAHERRAHGRHCSGASQLAAQGHGARMQ
jgi:hypothetical protein